MASPHRAEMERIVKSDAFQAACHYALLVLVEQQPDAENPAKAWDCHSRAVGAREVLRILQQLPFEPVKVTPPKYPTIYGTKTQE